MKCYILVFGLVASAVAQQYTTPVPILKQINKHNEDGSYSYGYEAADGTFRIESKYPNGEVYGKYGYKDDTGSLREVEYGATKRGFEPQGNDISVPPPTLNNDKNPARPLGPNEEDDGQYREDPSIYYKDEGYNKNSVQQPVYRKNYGLQQSFQQPQYTKPAYQQPSYQQPSYRQPAYKQPSYQQASSQPSYQKPVAEFDFEEFINAPFGPSQTQAKQEPLFKSQYQPQYQPQYQQPQYQQPEYQQPQYQPQYQQPLYQQKYQYPQTTYYNPQPSYQTTAYNDAQQLQGIPASNVNLDLGSYSVNYR